MEEFYNPLDTDEALTGGLNVDFEKIDRTKSWKLYADKTQRNIERADVVRRIIAGPVLAQYVWAPVVKKDDNDKEFAGYNVFRRNYLEKSTLLDKLYLAEKSVALQADPDAKDFQFKYDEKWIYLVLCREHTTTEVWLAEYNKNIKTGIREVQHKEHPVKKGFLLYGPAVLYDVMISKIFDKTKRGISATSYSVVVPESKFSGKVPLDFWERGFLPDFDFVARGVFTTDEMDAIEKFRSEHGGFKLNEFLRAYVAPSRDEDVMKALLNNPLNPFAEKKGKRVFPDPKSFMAELAKLNVHMLTAPKDLATKEESPVNDEIPTGEPPVEDQSPESKSFKANPFTEPPANSPKEEAKKAAAAVDTSEAEASW